MERKQIIGKKEVSMNGWAGRLTQLQPVLYTEGAGGTGDHLGEGGACQQQRIGRLQEREVKQDDLVSTFPKHDHDG